MTVTHMLVARMCFFLCRKKHVEKKEKNTYARRSDAEVFLSYCFPYLFVLLGKKGKKALDAEGSRVALETSTLNPKPQTLNPQPTLEQL